jgi:putative transposase
LIEELSENYPVKNICSAMGVARSAYYQWKRPRRSRREDSNELLLQEIRRVHIEHRGRLGSPRMTRELRRRGHACGRHRVARLMRRHQLRARGKRAFRPRTTQSGKAPCANLLKQLGAPAAPDRVWVSDITYIATKEGWLYLAVVLDLFSRKVLGWALRDTLHAELVATALDRALRQRQPLSGLCFHSDRGVQYSSDAVRAPLKAIQARQSMSARANCYDNATAEAFFSSFKTDCLPPNSVFDTKQQAHREIFEYLEVYSNQKRLHSSLGYQTPTEYEGAFAALLAPASNHANRIGAPPEDRALRGRNPSAGDASNTANKAGSAASRPPAGLPHRIEPHAKNPRGLGGQRPPSSLSKTI